VHGGFPLLSPQQKTASAVHENSPALKPGEGEAPPLRLVMLACPEEDAIFFPNESKRQRMSRQIIGRPRRLHSRLTATAPGSIEPENVLRTFLLAVGDATCFPKTPFHRIPVAPADLGQFASCAEFAFCYIVFFSFFSADGLANAEVCQPTARRFDVEHQEIALAGRITADLTHEMKNVLAILRESVGLMRDVLNLAGDARFPRMEKFETALSMCEKHLPRGLDVTNRLNRFAHCSDEAVDEADMAAMVGLAAELMARRASLEKLTVKADLPRGSVITYALIEAQLPGAEKITVTLKAKGRMAVIRAMASPLPKNENPAIAEPELDDAMKALGASMLVEHGRRESGLRLEAPLRSRAETS
jgi:hypothetical protein